MRRPIVFLLLALLAMALPSLAAEEPFIKMPDKPAYMGAAACNGNCHDPWYRAWKDTPHAKTYDLLKPGVSASAKRRAGINPDADNTKNPKCLRCHTTGYGQKGGFVPGETPVSDMKPSLEQGGCEMCHTGRGGNQLRVAMKKSKGEFKRNKIEQWGARYDYENVCRRCHGHPNSPHAQRGFNYNERKKNIHDYEKYYDEFNKTQTSKTDHGKGVTEKHPLMLEDWDIVEGTIRFKKLPLWDGWLIFKRK